MRTLILGGVRSGKSRYAEMLGDASGSLVQVIATGTAGDEEMARRIAAHRAARPAHWRVIEEPIHLARALRESAAAESVVLVDCLTLWLTNLLVNPDSELARLELDALWATLLTLPGDQIFIGNEVGLGIVPINALARRFIDEAGALHQRLAGLCDRVVLLVAGVPLTVKGSQTPT
jgi:adenosylcobinamide kinase/adenosylcobinamide-phosphate guanylyltransferase